MGNHRRRFLCAGTCHENRTRRKKISRAITKGMERFRNQERAGVWN